MPENVFVVNGIRPYEIYRNIKDVNFEMSLFYTDCGLDTVTHVKRKLFSIEINLFIYFKLNRLT